jgi:hypothetical protein
MSIPNTLTIFINTRIRNYLKIKYEPSMTVPKSRSHTVFFDPLVKLSASSVRNLPYGAPPSEKFTQFFNKNEFNGVIGRSLTSSLTGQKKISLAEAIKAGYIDNNIRITLDQLFYQNNIFYIKDQPYSIYSYNWTKGDWKVDTKSFEKQFSYVPYGMSMNYSLYRQPDGRTTSSEAERELKKLKDTIGDEAINGSVVDAGYSKFNQEDEKRKLLPDEDKGKGKSTVPKLTPEERVEIEKQKINTFVQQIQSLPIAQQSLYRDIIKISLVGNPGQPNFATNPLTQLILYQDKDSLLNDVNANIEIIGPLYTAMIDRNNDYLKKMDEYTKLLGEVSLETDVGLIDSSSISSLSSTTTTSATRNEDIMTAKRKYDELINSFKSELGDLKTNRLNKKTFDEILSDTVLKNKLLTTIQNIVNAKKKLFELFLKLYKILIDSMDLLEKFYDATSKFYIKLQYFKKIEYKDKKDILDLFILLSDFDIKNFDYLKNLTDYKDIKDQYEESKKKYEIIIKNIDSTTFQDKLKIYYDNVNLLRIDKNELDIDIITLNSIKSKYYKKIFEALFDTTEKFLNDNATKFAIDKINNTRELIKKYKPVSSTKNLKDVIKDNPILKNSIIFSGDCITFYAKLLIICMSREINELTNRLNLYNFIYRLLNEKLIFFNNIEYEITDSNFNIANMEIYESKYIVISQFISEGVLINDNIIPIDFASLKSDIDHIKDYLIPKINRTEIKLKLISISELYKNKLHDFIPKLSDSNMLLNCRLIIPTSNYLKNPFNLDSEIEVEQPLTHNEKKNMWLNSINTDNSIEIREYFYNLYKLLEKDARFKFPNILDKKLFDLNFFENFELCTYNEGLGDSIFGAIATAFNGELFFNNMYSTNNFTIKDGILKGYYDVETLRKAVADNFTEADIIDFNLNNYSSQSKDSPSMINYQYLFDDNTFIGNNLEKLKNNMLKPLSDFGKFWDPKIIIPKISKIFKVNIKILQKKNYEIVVGSFVKFVEKTTTPLTSTSSKGKPKIKTEIKDNFGFIIKKNGDKYDIIVTSSASERVSIPFIIKQNIPESDIFLYEGNFFVENCEENQKIMNYSQLPPDSPIIYLVENDDYQIPYYELLTYNPKDKLDRILDKIMQQSSDPFSLQQNIVICDKTPVTGFEQYVTPLPAPLNGYDIIKTVGDGNCALHSALLILNSKYRSLKFTPRPGPEGEHMCYDASLEKTKTGKKYKKFLKKNMIELGQVVNGLISTIDGSKTAEATDIYNQFFADEYLDSNIYQYFANYFNINFLVYQKSTNSGAVEMFKPYYINNKLNNKKWGMIYQTGNHFSAICKKDRNKIQFLFSYSDIEPILTAADVNNPTYFTDKLQEKDSPSPMEPGKEKQSIISNQYFFDANNIPYILKLVSQISGCLPIPPLVPPQPIVGGDYRLIGGKNNVPKSRYLNVNYNNQYVSNDSKLSYYVIIDLELYPGKEGIPLSQKAVLSCQSRYEKIRQAYSNIFGIQYRPNEFNSSIYSPSKNNKNNKNKQLEIDRERDSRNRRSRSRSRRGMYPPSRYTRRAPMYY